MTDSQRATPEEFLAMLQAKMPSLEIITSGRIIEYTKNPRMRDIIQSGLGFPALGGDPNRVEEIAAEYAEKIRKATAAKPLENPLWDGLLSDITKEIFQVLENNKIELPKQTVVGSLATGEVSAITIRVPQGGYVVALNSGLFLFIFLFAKAITSFLPTKAVTDRVELSLATEDVRITLEANTEGQRHFLEVISAYVLFGDAAFAPSYLQDGPQRFLTDILTHTAELFAVAHEISHIVLNHVSTSAQNRPIVESIETTELLWSWSDELVADRFGVDLTIAANQAKGLDIALSYAGVELFLACEDIVRKADGGDSSSSVSEDLAETVRRTVEEEGSSATPGMRQLMTEVFIAKFQHELDGRRTPDHPSSSVRRTLLREHLQEKLGKEAVGALDMGERLEQIVSSLWERNQDVFSYMRSILSPQEGGSLEDWLREHPGEVGDLIQRYAAITQLTSKRVRERRDSMDQKESSGSD